MFQNIDTPYRYLIYTLVFPVFFQEQLLSWAWQSESQLWMTLLKRILFLLPSAAVILACWLTIGAMLTVIVRQYRRQYVSTLVIAWWDLGRGILNFWGGMIRFCFNLLGWLLMLLRIGITGIWIGIQDLALTPVRAAKSVSNIATEPGTPWIAVILTLAWCALEAGVFSFVMLPLVIDTLSSVTGARLNQAFVQVILYAMLLAFIIGSYAIVATMETAVRSRNMKQIALIIVVEITALVFEVLFLYREFVDALTPWITMHAGEDFRLGFFPIILIASVVWAGTRGMTWFLFAAHGTPTIMAIIQRTGLSRGGRHDREGSNSGQFLFIKETMERVRKDMDWYKETGDAMLSSFVLPPLQILAAVTNFITLLISSKIVFQLPFETYHDLSQAEELIQKIKQERS